ncbi:MAG: hypothetical protein V3T81_01940 [Thermoanaerobaculia bacterium]
MRPRPSEALGTRLDRVPRTIESCPQYVEEADGSVTQQIQTDTASE